MENRITKILDKFNKAYKIDEEGKLHLQIQDEKYDYDKHERVRYTQLVMVEVVDEELGIIKFTETDSNDESSTASTFVSMDEVCSAFLKDIDCIESKED